MAQSLEQLLSSLDLGQYVAKFKQEEITDIKQVQALSENDLKELGLTLGARKKLTQALAGSAAAPSGSSAPPAAAASSAAKPPAAPMQDSKPITNLFKARAAEYKSFAYGLGPLSSEGTPLCFYADSMSADDDDQLIALVGWVCGGYDAYRLSWIQKSSFALMREVELDNKAILGHRADGRSLIGRGPHLALTFMRSSYTNGIGIFSKSDGSVVARFEQELFDTDDRIYGLAYPNNEQQICVALYRASQHYEMMIIDANTGEPLTKHDFGVNPSDIDNSASNNLGSHPLLPNVLLQSTMTKVQLLDVRRGLSTPVQSLPGAPQHSRFCFEQQPFGGGGLRVVLNGQGQQGGESQIWDLRVNKLAYKVPTKFSSWAFVHKNVVAGLGGDVNGGEVHLWDLTKITGGPDLGSPLKTYRSGTHHSQALFIDDHRIFSSLSFGYLH